MPKRTVLSALIAGVIAIPVAATARDHRPSAVELDTVMVEGVRRDSTLGIPSQILAGDDLARRRQAGIGETLSGLPGVHLDNFGGGASRPVIRGQTVPRIEVLSNGSQLFDASSVSPDHAITTDPLLLDAIEVVRGPAAVRYGGNASHGAIDLIDGKVPTAIPADGVSGAFEMRYGTGDGETAGVGRATAGAGAFAFHAEAAHRDSNDYKVPAGFGRDTLEDSFASSKTHAVGGAWITSGGYVGAAYTQHGSDYGLPGHSHGNGVCHTHGLDLHCESHGIWDDAFLGSDDSHTARIRLDSERFDVRADHAAPVAGVEHVRVRLSYTDYAHDEIDGDLTFAHYTQRVHDGRIELSHAPLFGVTGAVGVQVTDGTFSGLDYAAYADPVEFGFVEPVDYRTRQSGLFLHQQRAFGPVTVEWGLRKDWYEIRIPLPRFIIRPEDMAEIAEIETLMGLAPGGYMEIVNDGFRRQHPGARHQPLAVSASATWQLANDLSVAASLGRTDRVPGVRELYALGNNLATNSYEVGLAQTWRSSSRLPDARTDVLETTRSLDVTLRKGGDPWFFEIGAFHRDVDDYVFARLIETETEGGAPHHYLVYTAAGARFTGLDGHVGYRFTPRHQATLFGDYVRADLVREDDRMPRIPPMRLGARYEGAWGPLTTEFEYARTFRQDRFASYETATGGYDLVNATLAYRIDTGRSQPLELYLRGTNLTNQLAYVHTSFVKAQSPLRGRNLALGLRYQF